MHSAGQTLSINDHRSVTSHDVDKTMGAYYVFTLFTKSIKEIINSNLMNEFFL